jgi:hypothetical protein
VVLSPDEGVEIVRLGGVLKRPQAAGERGMRDLRGELLAPPGLRVDAPVVDPRRADHDRPRADRRATLTSEPVVHDQPPVVLVNLIDKRGDVLIGLDLQGRCDQPGKVRCLTPVRNIRV